MSDGGCRFPEHHKGGGVTITAGGVVALIVVVFLLIHARTVEAVASGVATAVLIVLAVAAGIVGAGIVAGLAWAGWRIGRSARRALAARTTVTVVSVSPDRRQLPASSPAALAPRRPALGLPAATRRDRARELDGPR